MAFERFTGLDLGKTTESIRYVAGQTRIQDSVSTSLIVVPPVTKTFERTAKEVNSQLIISCCQNDAVSNKISCTQG